MTSRLPLFGMHASLPAGTPAEAAAALLRTLGARVVHHPTAAFHATHGAQQCDVTVAEPWAAAHELRLAAACGALALTGEPNRQPVWPIVPVCGALTGLAATLSVLAGLLAGSPASQLVHPQRWLTYLMGIARARHETGIGPVRAGARNPALAPTTPYPDTLLPCADGWVHAHYAPSAPPLLAMILGESSPAPDATGLHAGTIDQALTHWLNTRTRCEAAALAQELRHPFVPVATLEELRQTYRKGLPPPVHLMSPVSLLRAPVPSQHAGPLPLSDIRVTELSVAVAGPMAGELLRLLGATVTRMAHLVAEAPGWYDRGKQTRTADLTTAGGRRELADTLAQSDVFLTNLSARAQQNLGLEALLQACAPPGLVTVTISAFPAGDRRHLWGAFDAGMQAAVGLADAVRYPDSGPLRVAGHPIDAATALVSACAALAGVRQRRQNGHGLSAEVSMLGAGLLLTAPLLGATGGPAEELAVATDSAESPPLETIAAAARRNDWLPF